MLGYKDKRVIANTAKTKHLPRRADLCHRSMSPLSPSVNIWGGVKAEYTDRWTSTQLIGWVWGQQATQTLILVDYRCVNPICLC